MQNMLNSKNSFTRIFYLFSLIPAYNAVPKSTTQLCQLMEEGGYKISKRTLERDLQKLRDITGIDCERTMDGNMWKHAIPQSKFNILMEPAEALTIMMTQGTIRKILPAPSQKYLDYAVNKAQQTLDHSNQFSRWKQKLFILSGETSAPALNCEPALNEAIYDAVLKEHQIEVMYKPFESDHFKRYELNPLAIVVRDHYIYLVATKVGLPEDFRLFSLYRMQSVDDLYIDIELPQTYALEAFIDKDFTRGMLSHEYYLIELKVRGYSYEWLKFNKLHEEQQISEECDGWYHVTFTDVLTYELAGWMLKQAADVIVISPEPLKDFVIECMENALAHYK